MIIGIGTDIIDTRRIKNIINKYGEKFKRRCFSNNEIIRSESSFTTVNSYAKRYAAKEACSKALGTGLAKIKGKVFRIGHLGDFNDLMLAGTLAGVEMGLKMSGIPYKSGGILAAVDFLSS